MNDVLICLQRAEVLVSEAEESLREVEAQPIDDGLKERLQSIETRCGQSVKTINDKKLKILQSLIAIAETIVRTGYSFKNGIHCSVSTHYQPPITISLKCGEDRRDYYPNQFLNYFPNEFYELCNLILAEVPIFVEKIIKTETKKKNDYHELRKLVRAIGELSDHLQREEKDQKK